MSRREFHFQEGTSQKFWAIDVAGTGFTVQFGRLGTAGQTQTKKFGSEQEAQKAADKLIAEKIKKGYAEVTKAPTPKALRKTAAPVEAALTPAQASPPLAAPPAVSRAIQLEATDWFWASWRELPTLPRPNPTPSPFDRAKCLEKVRALQTTKYGWWDYSRLPEPHAFSSAEARFWFHVYTGLHKDGPKDQKEKLAERLAHEDLDQPLSVVDIVAPLANVDNGVPLETLLAVVERQMAPADFLQILQDKEVMNRSWDTTTRVLSWFMKAVLPYIPREELASLRPGFRQQLQSAQWPTDFYKRPAPVYYLAALAGLHDELLRLVCSWPDDLYPPGTWQDYYHQPQFVVFGLGSADLVNQQMRRLKLGLKKPEHARAWLAHTELTEVDYLRDAVLALSKKQEAEDLLRVFCLVQAPEAASHMLQLRIGSKVPKLAGEWLEQQPGNAIAGLIPVAAGKGKLAEAAVEYLREARKKGAAVIEEQLKQASPEVDAKVRQAVLEHEEKVFEALTPKAMPKELREAFEQIPAGTPSLPAWLRLPGLPPLLLGGRRLPDEQVLGVLSALRQSPLGSPLPVLRVLKQHADRASLDSFTWRMFELWLAEGAPSKEKWALFAIGHLGGDALALKLMPFLRAWPGESQHQRAVTGLECLRAMGTDTALMQLNGIAQKLKFQGLKKKAQEFMEAIATDKGLTREELEDRIVPDLDLDERGTRVFDFGPRQFRVVLGPDLTPLVRDEAGKAKGDLPKPGAKDDAAKADAASAEWRLLKKQLRETLKVQAPRLEQAMVTGRRWPFEQFETLLVRHPLMTNLARRVLWGGYDNKGQLAGTFRVTEDQQLADVEDRPCPLKGIASVGIVHPLHLTEEQRAAWGQVFGDYEIISPFLQLGRPIQLLEPSEAKAKTIQRLDKVLIPPLAVRGTLDKLGWARGSASDHGVVQEFFKHFPGTGVTALLQVEPGIPMGMPDLIGDQKVERVFFLSGLYDPAAYPYHKEKDFLALNKTDPIAVSEVLADLATLASKAK